MFPLLYNLKKTYPFPHRFIPGFSEGAVVCCLRVFREAVTCNCRVIRQCTALSHLFVGICHSGAEVENWPSSASENFKRILSFLGVR